MAGAVTQQDLSRESFRQHMSSSAGRHILVIHCSVFNEDPKFGKLFGFLPGSQVKFNYDAVLSRQAAYRILDTAMAQSRQKLGWQPTMALIVLADNDTRQIYALPKTAGIPVYVVSPGIVEGGAAVDDGMNRNMLRLAEATDDYLFPYETSAIEPHRRSHKAHIVDEFNAINFELSDGFKGVANSPAEIEQLNACRRTNFLHAVSVAWPSVLPDTHGASDVMYISWRGLRGGHRIGGRLSVSGSSNLGFRLALVSIKDRVVYYFQQQFYDVNKNHDHLKEPSNRLLSELERIKRIPLK